VALAFFDRSRTVGEAFMATVLQEPEEWQDAAAVASTDLWLTAHGTVKLSAALAAVLEPYRGLSLTERPDSTRRVRVMNMTVPHSTR
jgi:hypothetical protein